MIIPKDRRFFKKQKYVVEIVIWFDYISRKYSTDKKYKNEKIYIIKPQLKKLYGVDNKHKRKNYLYRYRMVGYDGDLRNYYVLIYTPPNKIDYNLYYKDKSIFYEYNVCAYVVFDNVEQYIKWKLKN